MTDQPRTPAGSPTGGQFAGIDRPEADIDLGAQPAPEPLVEFRRGVYRVVNTTTTQDHADGFTATRVHLGGQPHLRAGAHLVGLRLQRREDPYRIDGPLDDVPRAGKKATLLLQHLSGDVEAVEGTMYPTSEGTTVLTDKGNRKWPTAARVLRSRFEPSGSQVLAVREGYGHAEELAAVYRDLERTGPSVVAATFDGIPDCGEDEPPSEIAAAFVFDHPGFDGTQDGRGSVFLATDIQTDDGIVNGYAIFAATSGLVSEHGSFTTAELERWGGRVEGFVPESLTFSDAIRLGKQAEAGDITSTWDAVSGRTDRQGDRP